MGYDGLHDPEVEEVANDTDSTYEEAQEAKWDSEDPKPSTEAIKQIDEKTYKKEFGN